MTQSPSQKHFQLNPYAWFLTPFFFLFIYLYVWLRIEPVLYFQSQSPVFFIDQKFFSEFLSYPGGIVEYLAAFLSQFYYYSWAGALVVVLILGLVALATAGFIHALKPSRKIEILPLIPVVLLVILHNKYPYPLANSLALLVSLAAVNIYLWLTPRQPVMRIAIFLVLLTGLYFVAAGPFLLFALICGLFELLVNRHYLMALVYLVVPVILPYLAANYIFIITLKAAFTHLLPFDNTYISNWTPYALYLFFPFVLIGVIVSERVFPVKTDKKRITKDNLKFITQTALLFIAFFSGLLVTFDQEEKLLLKTDVFARQGQWDQILALAQSHKNPNEYLTFQTNRALAHCGRLMDDMFSFPQNAGVDGLFLPKPYRYKTPLLISDIFFDLAHVNEAQHWAHEALAVTGFSPANLKRLVQVNLLKGEKQAALKFLTLLEKTILFRDWAHQYRTFVDHTALFLEKSEFQQIRASMPTSDFLVNVDYPEIILEFMLQKNKHNQIAFEYLMAFYLLTRKLDRFVENIHLLKAFNYTHIPRHFQEALLVYINYYRHKKTELPKLNINVKIIQDYKKFSDILNRCKGNKNKARNEVMKLFGNTYWAYLLYAPQYVDKR